MPPKVDKKKKPKRARAMPKKASKNIKQIVKVQVQSSGGSGAGGTSVPAASSPVPASFFDRSGENVQLRSLLQQAIAAQGVPRSIPLKEEIPVNPANDAATTEAIFNAKSNLDKAQGAGVGPINLKTGGGLPEIKESRAEKKARLAREKQADENAAMEAQLQRERLALKESSL